MVLSFLETRNLTAGGFPYQFYDATTGLPYDGPMESTIDLADSGRLFVALNNLILFNSSYTANVTSIVKRCYSAYAVLVPGIENDISTSTDIYSYYVYTGFADFFPINPSPSKILTNILAAPNVTT